MGKKSGKGSKDKKGNEPKVKKTRKLYSLYEIQGDKIIRKNHIVYYRSII